MGRKGEAKSAYKQASLYSTVYYGQLAREKLGLGRVPEEIDSGKASSAAEAKAEKDEVVRAFKIMTKAGSQNDLYMFLWSFAQRFDSTDEMNAVASVVWDAGGATMAVRLAKAAAARNVDIDSWGYPIRALPDWKQIGKPVEKPLVFALARQESEFNPKAGSKVGAQGLMQIMPGTAKLIAKQHGIKHNPGKLMDPEYNVKLGAAHLGDLIADHGGSYVLTLVSYNAGPRRSREWVAGIRRPPHRRSRPHRLGRIDPLPGDAPICAEGAAEPACLPLAPRPQDGAADDGGPGARLPRGRPERRLDLQGGGRGRPAPRRPACAKISITDLLTGCN